MTKLTLKNASIASCSGDDEMFEITLICRQKGVDGEIVEAQDLDVEIKSKYEK